MIEEHKTTYYIRGSPFIPRSKDTWVFWRHGDRLAPVDGTAPPSSGSKPAIILLYETGINWYKRWDLNPHSPLGHRLRVCYTATRAPLALKWGNMTGMIRLRFFHKK